MGYGENSRSKLNTNVTNGKGYVITVEGEPKMVVSMDMEDKHGDRALVGVIQTATAIVSSIPAVVDHKPGMVAAFDLP